MNPNMRFNSTTRQCECDPDAREFENGKCGGKNGTSPVVCRESSGLDPASNCKTLAPPSKAAKFIRIARGYMTSQGSGTLRNSARTLTACRTVCDSDPSCKMFTFTRNRCRTYNTLPNRNLGVAVQASRGADNEDGQRYSTREYKDGTALEANSFEDIPNVTDPQMCFDLAQGSARAWTLLKSTHPVSPNVCRLLKSPAHLAVGTAEHSMSGCVTKEIASIWLASHPFRARMRRRPQLQQRPQCHLLPLPSPREFHTSSENASPSTPSTTTAVLNDTFGATIDGAIDVAAAVSGGVDANFST